MKNKTKVKADWKKFIDFCNDNYWDFYGRPELLEDFIKKNFVAKGDLRLAQAEAQLTGFHQCRDGAGGIEELVFSMGLEKEEWKILKKEYGITDWLPKDMIEDVESYFKSLE